MEYQPHKDATAHGVSLFCGRTGKQEQDCEVPEHTHRCISFLPLVAWKKSLCSDKATKLYSLDQTYRGRPKERWVDEIIRKEGEYWLTKVKDIQSWGKMEEAFTR
ncbi:jg174, partial [Pararge aegeria aegeria]